MSISPNSFLRVRTRWQEGGCSPGARAACADMLAAPPARRPGPPGCVARRPVLRPAAAHTRAAARRPPAAHSMTAMRWPWSPWRMWFSSVVLPEPRNPVMTWQGRVGGGRGQRVGAWRGGCRRQAAGGGARARPRAAQAGAAGGGSRLPGAACRRGVLAPARRGQPPCCPPACMGRATVGGCAAATATPTHATAPASASAQPHSSGPLVQRTVTGTRSSMTLPCTSITSPAAAAVRTARRCPEAAAAAAARGGRHPLAGATACRAAAGACRQAAAPDGGAGRAAAGRQAAAGAAVLASALLSMAAGVNVISPIAGCARCHCKRLHLPLASFGALLFARSAWARIAWSLAWPLAGCQAFLHRCQLRLQPSRADRPPAASVCRNHPPRLQPPWRRWTT